MPELAAIAAIVFAYALFSRRLEPTILTAPMVFASVGLVLGAVGANVFEYEVGGKLFVNDVALTIAELALVLVLFTDAVRINVPELWGHAQLPTRLLGVAMPLVIAAGAVSAGLLFDGLSLWEAALLAAVLAPTDAALGLAVVLDRRVPLRIRQTLNVEAGLNDGLAVPFVTVFLALAVAEEGSDRAPFWLGVAAEQIGYGVLVGIGIGVVGGKLVEWAGRRSWMTRAFQQLSILALAVIAWRTAEIVDGSGFIAAFVAGLVVGHVVTVAGERVIDFTEEEGHLLNLTVFLAFGVVAVDVLADLTWEIVLFAVLSLTLIRMVPVAISLVRTGLAPATVGFVGWFGPRGLASIILGLIVLEQAPDLPGGDTIGPAVTMTVLLSIFAHGITSAPLAGSYAGLTRRFSPDAPELGTVTRLRIPTRLGYMPNGRPGASTNGDRD